MAGLALIGMVASAAICQERSRTLDRTPLSLIPMATSSVGATGNQSQTTIDGDRAKSAYFAEFTGIAAEGRDMVWRGAVAGVAVGELTVRLAHVGRDIDTEKPTWPVEGIIFVSGEDPRRAFAAEVHGTIDWPTKRVNLVGEVSTGYMRGSRVEQTGDLIDGDLSGELRFAPETLAVR
ncbi:MAG: hypothetical protein M3Y30_08310 [Gemmatimonadota bacterium]|nr:hypothetical protein [Gemmatimonadota bacterium]